ncbi:putative P450 monooxygenase [Rhizodiscina lignyota]|uniref:P450 monooxygenase n=1 Tax=Rhizodiscina lignyota TaxID=1504668 RepID=A0A9P4M744_9PEZI|nr:putative P450 monooxygenase [Rhizodiscina lignyota]
MKLIIPLLLFVAYTAYKTYLYASKLYRNLLDARRSGIPYIVAPVWPINRLWLALEPLLMPYLRKMPFIRDKPWLMVSSGDWIWQERYGAFEKLGDTFMIVTPRYNAIYTAEAEVINQITTRRNDFPKPIQVYGTLDLYGKNVVTSEGSEWRRHRKITSPPFTEKNNHLVWNESLYQASNMVTQWVGKDGKAGKTWDNISTDAMRLSLHVISRAGFNVRCLWPGVDDDDEQALKEGAMSTAIIPEGHEMSYVESMSTMLHRIIVVLICPDWLMKYFPSDFLKKARLAYFEWGRYMKEIYQSKFDALKKSAGTNADEKLDLMGAMISSSGLLDDDATKAPTGSGLSESEILGNSFVFMLAGHETAANTITHALYFLAMNPGTQQRLQKEIDDIFGGRPISEWNYDRDLNPLFGGLAGAIMNETLRVIPPVVIIPKSNFKSGDQKLTVGGKEVIVPDNTYIGLCAAGVQRNPKYWPHGPARSAEDGGPMHPKSNLDNDLEEFKPERWLLDPNAKPLEETSDDEKARKEAEAMGVNTAPDTANTLFRPPKGAYVPFSEGYRACLGRRFAQVEILATLAVIFSQYSVELGVEDWADDEEVEKMGEKERKDVWLKARTEAERKVRDCMGTIITLQLRKGKIPMRFAKRGEEKFMFA